MPEPSLGRIVMFRDSQGDADHPAIITAMSPSQYLPNADTVMLTIFYPLYSMSGVAARYSADKIAGTWHWPTLTPVMQGKSE